MQVRSVLLLDDGELESAREVLDRLDAEVVWRRARTVKPWIAGKHDLLITTAPCALASENVFRTTPRHQRPVWIAFHNQDFLPLRERLREIGVDYLVHTTIEPELLRLLFLRILFRDRERRRATRLPAGASVTCRMDGRELAVTLAEISPGGCLLLSPAPTEPSASLVLELPPELGDAASASRIPGRVARVERIPREPEGALWKLAVEFDRNADAPAPSLARLETGRAIGARVTCFEDARVAAMGTSAPPAPEEREARPVAASGAGARNEEVRRGEPAPGPEAPAPDEVPKDRRSDPRASLAGRKLTLLDEESGVVFGRDLSRRGVRLEHRGGISVGATLAVAIPGLPREEPLVMRGVVARDDGPDGLAVLFYGPQPPESLARLDRIVASLPPIETLADESLVPERLLVVGPASRQDS